MSCRILEFRKTHVFPNGSKPRIVIHKRRGFYVFKSPEHARIGRIIEQRRADKESDRLLLSVQGMTEEGGRIVMQTLTVLESQALGVYETTQEGRVEDRFEELGIRLLTLSTLVVTADNKVLFIRRPDGDYFPLLNSLVSGTSQLGLEDNVAMQVDDELGIYGRDVVISPHSIHSGSYRIDGESFLPAAVTVFSSAKLPITEAEVRTRYGSNGKGDMKVCALDRTLSDMSRFFETHGGGTPFARFLQIYGTRVLLS